MSQKSRQSVLIDINSTTDNAQFQQLQLGAVCLGVSRGTVDTAEDICKIEECLNIKYPSGVRVGSTLVYALLKCIGVDDTELQNLVPFIDSGFLEQWQNSLKFQFAELCIYVCNSMSAVDYKKFFSLVDLKPKVNIEKLPTIMSLLRELINQGKISTNDVKFLSEKLDEAQFVQTLEVVDKYRKRIGSISQEGATNADLTGASLLLSTKPVQEQNDRTGYEGTDEDSLLLNQKSSKSGSSGTPNLISGSTADPCVEKDRGKKKEGHEMEPVINPKDQDHKDTQEDRTQNSDEESENSSETSHFLPSSTEHQHNTSNRWSNPKRCACGFCTSNRWSNPKRCACGFYCGAIFLLFVSLAFILSGSICWSSLSNSISSNTLNDTKLGIENFTILMSIVDSCYMTDATVSEKPQVLDGDQAHINYVYTVRQTHLKVYTIPERKEIKDTRHEAYPSRNIIELMDYFLYKSSFNLTFYAMNPASNTGDGSIHLFDDTQQLDKYKDGKSFRAIASKQLNIGTFNVSEPTFFQYKVDRPAFYFIAIQSPTDLYYSYLFESNKVFVNGMDYEKSCPYVYEGSPCSLKFAEDGLYYVLAFIKPLTEFGSPTTHLQLITSGIPESAQKQITVFKSLTVAGCVAFVLVVMLVIIVCVIASYKRRTI